MDRIYASTFAPGDFRWRSAAFDSLDALIQWTRENPKHWASPDSDPTHYYADGIRHRMADGAIDDSAVA